MMATADENLARCVVRLHAELKEAREKAPLSFRDQCAIAAITMVYDRRSSEECDDEFSNQGIALECFQIADAMEKERKKRSAK